MEGDTHFWSDAESLSQTPIPQEIITLTREFANPGWETIGRMQDLSGLTQHELSDLPSNGMIARAFTALLRTWQVHTRSKSIEENPDVPQTGLEDLAKQGAFLKRDEPKFEEKQEIIRNAPILISPDGSDRHFVGRVLNDYLNPFATNTDNETITRKVAPDVYGTEYAQLVNIACRREGLGPWSTFKMTLLASMQRPPGLQEHKETAQKLLRGERFAMESELTRQDEFLTCVPLTVERLRDPSFVGSISLRKILSSPKFTAATKEFYNNAFPKKS